jgi:hypothetical protein
MAAHTLAKEVAMNFMDKVWTEECPPCILNLVNLERLALAL